MRVHRIRALIGTLPTAALILGLAACGDSRTNSTPKTIAAAHSAAAGVPPNISTHASDRDNDDDHNDDDEPTLRYGHNASAAERRQIVALVTRYFTAAAAGNGAAGCLTLAPAIAETFSEENRLSPQLGRKKCAAVLSSLYKQNHPLLVEKRRTLRVTSVRVQGDYALAILYFPAIPFPEVRLIDARRTDGSWGLVELLDGKLF
jgi:hypothetical protein